MRTFGFDERIIYIVWKLISNNWYSKLINGQYFGFFNLLRTEARWSLSPTLFIIAADVLAWSLNKLNEDSKFKRFGRPKWSREIIHLYYGDIRISFCSWHKRSMKKIMKIFQRYEYVSGQLISLNKSYVYLHEKVLFLYWSLTRCLSFYIPWMSKFLRKEKEVIFWRVDKESCKKSDGME